MSKQRMKDATLTGASHGLVAYWKRLGWDGPSCGTIDVTDVSSAGDWKEYLAGLKDGGSVSLSLQFNKVLWASLHAALGGTDTWTLALADGSTLVASGILTQAPGASGELESGVDSDVTIKLSGPVTFT
jgi:hypothetical protein